MESIRALERLDNLNDDVEVALINDISANPYTTAYISARILGNFGCVSAIPLLRERISSNDYMLAGEAMFALAKLRDKESRHLIEHIILNTQNPRLKIMGSGALGVYGVPDSLYALLDMFRGTNPPPYLRNEITLAMSAILDTENQFYRILVRYVAEPALFPMLAMDEAEAAYEFFNTNLGRRKNSGKNNELSHLVKQAKNIQAVVASLVHNNDNSLLSRWIMELPAHPFTEFPAFGVAQSIFAEALLDDEFSPYKRLQLLICHWATYQIRIWTKRLK
jgi:hypothetical protein